MTTALGLLFILLVLVLIPILLTLMLIGLFKALKDI